MPGSPEISTTWPSPVLVFDQRRRSNSISSSRPTSAVRPAACSASKRLSTVLARSATHARSGSATPLRSLAPRSLSSTRLPRSLRVGSAMTTVFGSAIPLQPRCKVRCLTNDAAFVHLARSSHQIAHNHEPSGDANTGLQSSRRLECNHCCNQLQPGTHCALGVILMGLRVAKVDKHAVPQILRHEAAEATHGFCDALLVGRYDFAQVFRVHARRECH